VAGQKEEHDMQQTDTITQWKALYSAFRAALNDEPPPSWGYVHPDVAAVRATASAVENGVRAGFALRHAGKLGAVLAGAEAARLAWERPMPGALATLPRYERGMLWPRRRIQARGYSPRWEPRFMPRPPVQDLPEEVLVEAAA
jgi:hypothetical protein